MQYTQKEMQKNSNWTKWNERNRLDDMKQPGIYFIAHTNNDISGQPFSLIEEIIYIGMTISNNGLKGRLDQFLIGMKGKMGIHGGAERVKFKHKDEKLFFRDCYVSVCPFPLSKSRDTVTDLRIKGECVKHEYTSFADYMAKFGRLPEFNDQERSKKK
jgi:hypothetical protein